jgi:hypothetical protein
MRARDLVELVKVRGLEYDVARYKSLTWKFLKLVGDDIDAAADEIPSWVTARKHIFDALPNLGHLDQNEMANTGTKVAILEIGAGHIKNVWNGLGVVALGKAFHMGDDSAVMYADLGHLAEISEIVKAGSRRRLFEEAYRRASPGTELYREVCSRLGLGVY